MRSIKVIIVLNIIIFLILLKLGFSADRCQSFVTSVRVEHIKQFGLTFPWHYGVGQLMQESNCRATITAFDAGMGVAQFMPKTSTYIQGLMGEKLDPYNPKQAIRMQAFYMKRINTIENWSKSLFVSYQIYNGGKGALYSEYKRAGVLDWNSMRKVCQRKKIQFKWGVLDLCDVNYDYSKKIEKYGGLYRIGPDQWEFWNKGVINE